MSTTELLVRKSSLSDARLHTREDTPLAPGQVRVGIDAFALTKLPDEFNRRVEAAKSIP